MIAKYPGECPYCHYKIVPGDEVVCRRWSYEDGYHHTRATYRLHIACHRAMNGGPDVPRMPTEKRYASQFWRAVGTAPATAPRGEERQGPKAAPPCAPLPPGVDLNTSPREVLIWPDDPR